MTKLYVYTEPAWENTEWVNGNRVGFGLVKVGMTTQDTVDDRIKQHFHSKKPYEHYKILFEQEIGELKDYDIHKALEKAGAYRFPSTEWFECTSDEVKYITDLVLNKKKLTKLPQFNNSSYDKNIKIQKNKIKLYQTLLFQKQELETQYNKNEIQYEIDELINKYSSLSKHYYTKNLTNNDFLNIKILLDYMKNNGYKIELDSFRELPSFIKESFIYDSFELKSSICYQSKIASILISSDIIRYTSTEQYGYTTHYYYLNY